jgi:hypothetical protein
MKMDRELAGAVIDRWSNGLPVAETALYKAASALGIDPMAALIEARFYTYFDQYLLEKRAMTRTERKIFSAAAGMEPSSMEKAASSFGFTTDELIVEALRRNGFVPNIEKIANLTAITPDPANMQMQMDPMAMQQQAPDPMSAMPQQGQAVQQQPQARTFKPSPTAPEQMAANPQGNLQDLLSAQQTAFQDPSMQGNGGQPPAAGMPEPAPPPPSPEERIQQVGPNLDPETVSRYAEQLARFEQGVQMQISDPKQMVKFVKELQKVDGKRIDQGIKAMGQQLEQEQAAELGVDGTPTIEGPGGMGGGQSVMAPKPGGTEMPQSAPTPQSPPQAAQPDAQSSGGDTQQMQAQPSPPKPKNPPAQPQQAAQQAVEKVAHAARLLARAISTR